MQLPSISVKPHIFQFHLVRLKDAQEADEARDYDISIPFSTIKSQIPMQAAHMNPIFQFHLVRLKVAAVLLSCPIIEKDFNSI